MATLLICTARYYHCYADLLLAASLLLVSRFLLSQQRRSQCSHQRHREDDAQTACQAPDDLDSHKVCVHELDVADIVGIDEDHHVQAGAGKGQHQRIGHGTHGIPSDVHAGLEELQHGTIRVHIVEL